MREKRRVTSIIVGIGLILFGITGYVFSYWSQTADRDSLTTTSTTITETTSETSSSEDALPDVSASDWELVLVNRENRQSEMNPDLTAVDGISVDSRIADQVADFLAAAQAIDSREHLISGYRSVAYQEQLYQGYVEQEMASDTSLTEEEAEALVQTYSQPAGASEHQTGLAIDISTVDALNQSDAATVAKLCEIAPDYGFVLRFPEGKSDITGVGYEDWHFRYVGVASAHYMTANQLTLEEYVALLEESGL